MRVADFIIERLRFLGVDTAFLVTGGGAMHLNDALVKCNEIQKIYCHHEQGCSIAAEAFARVAGKPAIVNVTTGPGGVNALNGVFGAYTDSIPMIILSGQVKRETMMAFNNVEGLRQLGDQEINILDMVKPITKWHHLLKDTDKLCEIIDRAYVLATDGRPGPVWIDIPVDVQGLKIGENTDAKINAPKNSQIEDKSLKFDLNQVVESIQKSKRPVIFAGSGIRISKTESDLLELAELLGVPVVTAWTHDIFPNDHELFAGRPGTIGTRAGNFVVQQADLLLILGSRLNIRQVSYNYKSFAKNAYKIWVDIDAAELNKPFNSAELKIEADLRLFIPALTARLKNNDWSSLFGGWVSWCQHINRVYTPKPSDYPESLDRINPYHFVYEMFERLSENDIVICANATATIVPYQIGYLRGNMRLISNSGSASMGYDLPATLGAAIADPNKRIICLAGDGSIMMNLQELQTIRQYQCKVKIFVLENDGYLSIKQTQRNFFGREGGASAISGVTFPDFGAIAHAFGFKSYALNKENWKIKLNEVLSDDEAISCVVPLDLVQEFEPRLKSKMTGGKIETPELDDMYPFMENKILEAVRASALDCK
jgi:acetolactate synthase-1/2/3 large subunit